MDFDHGVLDLRYYAGTGRLLLHQPDEAAHQLRGSLAALPTTHAKARAVLTLAIADAQADQLDETVDLTRQALASATHQPIMPILRQARRVDAHDQPHADHRTWSTGKRDATAAAIGNHRRHGRERGATRAPSQRPVTYTPVCQPARS
jgi:hypothetical protein